MTKFKTIVLLDKRFFNTNPPRTENGMDYELEKWLNSQLTYDRYKVVLCDFPVADCSIIKSINVGGEV